MPSAALPTHPSPIVNAQTVLELLSLRAAKTPNLELLLAPARIPMTALQLLHHTQSTAATLNSFGLSATDRIASLIPAGPESATLLYAITSCATHAPLNPNFHPLELHRSLAILNAKALILAINDNSPIRAYAHSQNILVLDLITLPDQPAGSFQLTSSTPNKNPASPQSPTPADLFYLLQTSGTTARPKVVPITQQAFLTAVAHNVHLLRLTPADRTIQTLSASTVMGMTTLVYSLMAGAQIVSIPPLAPADFFRYVREFQPTWLTAPPSVHQSILRYAQPHLDYLAQNPLRFIRSGASSLSPTLLRQIEQTWNAPLVEAYAMSECPMIVSNHAPPGPHKPGAAGLPTGMQIALLTPDHQILENPAPNQTGEILLSGPHLMHAYENNPQANADAFLNGYFRTGDLGYFDADHFLFLVGRNKEIINRGGHKISPREIEEAVLSHPSVVEAAAFPAPDPRLGESVAIAVVLKPSTTASQSEIRLHAAASLSPHKVPDNVFFLEQIPTGPTGKIQRLDLARKLGLQSPPPSESQYVPARTSLEQDLVSLWAFVLQTNSPISIHDRFVDLGGDSLQAVAMFAELDRLLGQKLPVSTLIQFPTIASLAQSLTNKQSSPNRPVLVPIQPHGSRTPLFCLPGMYGNVFTFFPLSRSLGPDQPVYGFQLPETDGSDPKARNVQILATTFRQQMQTLQPQGPYQLCGYSFGAYLAYEIAQQLLSLNQKIHFLCILDTRGPAGRTPNSAPAKSPSKIQRHVNALLHATDGPRLPYALGLISRRFKKPQPRPASDPCPLTYPPINQGLEQLSFNATAAYKVLPYPDPLLIVRVASAPNASPKSKDPKRGWGEVARNIQTLITPGDHGTMLSAPHAPTVVKLIAPHLLQP